MPLGTLMLGLGLFALGSVHAMGLFFLIAVLARALSQPVLIGVVPQTLAVSFFRHKRNLALALTGLFRPISGAILIQLVSAIAAVYSWRTAFRSLGILSVLLTLPMLLIIRRRPEDIGLLPDGDHVEAPTQTGSVRRLHNPGSREADLDLMVVSEPHEPAWTAREVLGTATFWLIALASFLSVSSGSLISFNMVPYLHEEVHLSMSQAAGVLSLSTVFALVNLVWGYVADKLTPRRCMIGTMLGAAGTVLLLVGVDSLFSAYVFGILWGIVSSSQVLIYMILAHYFGQASYGTIAGSLRPFEAGGLGVGQSLGAVLYEMTGSYSGLMVASFGALLLAALLMFLARPPAAPVVLKNSGRIPHRCG
jgi:sugar phosphate permease